MGTSRPPGPTSTWWGKKPIGPDYCAARLPVMKSEFGPGSIFGLIIVCFLGDLQTILPTESLPLSHLPITNPQGPTCCSLMEAANGGRLHESWKKRRP